MLRIIKLFTIGLVLLFAYSACEKEYSEENGLLPGSASGGTQSGTAVFTLAGAPNACLTPLVSGTYTVGTPLNVSNTIIVTVDVTTIGTYVISTGTANGISFSGSGDFTVTGTQVLVLTGSGTPAAAGTFSYAPGTNGCTFSITATGIVGPTAAAGTLDCTAATTAGTYTQGVALTSSNTVTIPVNVTVAGTYSITTIATNGVTFAGSGSLALGLQTIVLTGSGLPINSGSISIPVSLGTSTCNFSITFAVGVPPAEGTLDCATATVAGTYTQGVALTASNTISIPVNVTLAGPYLITTTTTNGVTFSGSGTLALGAQTIVLTGSGTPANSGTVSIPVSLGTSNCSVSIDFIAGSTDFLKCSVDGGPITNFNGSLIGSLAPGGFSVSGSSASQDLSIDITNLSGGNIGTGAYSNVCLTNANIFTTVGLTSGATSWFDIDATASCNIFTVNITSISANNATGTFNGKLSDLVGGTTKMITNGSFSISY